MKHFFHEFWNLSAEMSPYLLFGFLIAALLKYFISDSKVTKIAGKSSFLSDLKLSLFGIPLPLCSCGVIPTGISLFKSGASKSATTSFFISTPQTGVDSIAVTYSLINLPFALMRPIIAFFTAIFGGFLVRLFKAENLKIPNTKSPQKTEINEKLNFKQSLRYAFIDFLDDISKWLVIGIALAALITLFIPDHFFDTYFGNAYTEMILILAVSIPLYVCATGSVPIAAALLLKGLSPGAALVFLMAGPATNMATITLIKKVLGTKTLMAYLISITTGAFVFGSLLNYFMPQSWMNFSIHSNNHVHMLPHWLELSSGILFLGLILSSFYRKYFAQYFRKKTNSDTNTIQMKNSFKMANLKTIKVNGMTCNHCKSNVEKAIKVLDGISDVKIDLEKGTVELDGDGFSLSEIKTAVDDIGYEYAGEL